MVMTTHSRSTSSVAMTIPAMASPPRPACGELMFPSVVVIGGDSVVVDGQGVGTSQRHRIRMFE